MQLRLPGEFRVEREREQMALLCEYDDVLQPTQGLAFPPNLSDGGGPDEDASRRADPVDLQLGLKRLLLPSEGVPINRHVHEG